MADGVPFGNYRLQRRLARGGMAEVFLAWHVGVEGFERRVAIKRILPHLSDSEEFRSMFLDEARLAAQLTHPNVVHIYDFGKVDDYYFIAMEFVDGVDLGRIIRQAKSTPIPFELAARILADMCAGLYYAHNITDGSGKPLQVVHRDVTPQNVLVTYDGVVKVVDFGIAKATWQAGRTRPGMVKGKYAYMSPEQVEGRTLDARSDLFSAGICFFELLTGVPLFRRDNVTEAMREIRDGKPIEPEKFRADLPRELAGILRRALATAREERYLNGSVMQHDLEKYLKNAAQLATPQLLGQFLLREFPRPAEEDSIKDGVLTPPADASRARSASQASAGQPEPPPGDALLTTPGKGALLLTGGSDRSPAVSRTEHMPSGPKGTFAVGPLGKGTFDVGKSAPQGFADVSEDDEATRRDKGGMSTSAARGKTSALPDASDDDATAIRPPTPAQGTSALPSRSRTELATPRAESLSGPPTPLTRTEAEVPVAPASWPPSPSSSGSGEALPWPEATPASGERAGTSDPRMLPFGKDPVAPLSHAAESSRSTPGQPRSSAGRWLPFGALALFVSVGIGALITYRPWAPQPDPPRRVDPPTSRPAEPLKVPVPVPVTTPLPVKVTALDILSRPPGARVVVDGKAVETLTPINARAFTPGTHHVVLEHLGYHAHEMDVVLAEGEHRTLDLELRELKQAGPPLAAPRRGMGTLTAKTTPWSKVYDGPRLLGETPLANVPLSVGAHVLTFSNPDFPSVKQRVVIRAGEERKLSLELKK
jgi:serine/threonine-protein kinase